eukprot:10212635-Lingulodinium_polyedra.AAC.1
MKTYHKLMTSYRPEHALKRQEWGDEVKYKRRRANCELELRTAEFATWTLVDQSKNPQYATETQVHKDHKTVNKGRAYAATASHITQARKEIKRKEAQQRTQHLSIGNNGA